MNLKFGILGPEEAKKRVQADIAEWKRQKEIQEKRAKVEADKAKQNQEEGAITALYVPRWTSLDKQKNHEKAQQSQRQDRLDRKLIKAVKNRNVVGRIVFLLERGANPNCMEYSNHGTPIGDTPLLLALKSKINAGEKEAIVENLFAHGADPNIADDKHYTPLMIVVEDKYALSLAELLILKGADVNAKIWSESVLKIAARNGYNQMTDLLIKHGARE